MAQKIINTAKTPLATDDITQGSTITTVTADILAFTVLATGVADVGSAAGTIVLARTSQFPVYNQMADRIGELTDSDLSSSITFTNGVIISAQEKAFEYDAAANERYTLTAAKLTVNGDWACDYQTGLFVIRKATAATSVTIDYKTPTPSSGGSSGPTANVNVNQWGGSATTLGQKPMAASVPVTIASDQSAIPVIAGASSTVLDGTGTITVTGVAQQIIVASTPSDNITVQNDTDNLNDMFIGSATSQSIQLSSGQSYTIAIDNANKIYVLGTIGDRFNFGGIN